MQEDLLVSVLDSVGLSHLNPHIVKLVAIAVHRGHAECHVVEFLRLQASQAHKQCGKQTSE